MVLIIRKLISFRRKWIWVQIFILRILPSIYIEWILTVICSFLNKEYSKTSFIILPLCFVVENEIEINQSYTDGHRFPVCRASEILCWFTVRQKPFFISPFVYLLSFHDDLCRIDSISIFLELVLNKIYKNEYLTIILRLIEEKREIFIQLFSTFVQWRSVITSPCLFPTSKIVETKRSKHIMW